MLENKNAIIYGAGGGIVGNFGVATRFQFRLHEVDTIVGGMLLLPATPDVISLVRRRGGDRAGVV